MSSESKGVFPLWCGVLWSLVLIHGHLQSIWEQPLPRNESGSLPVISWEDSDFLLTSS